MTAAKRVLHIVRREPVPGEIPAESPDHTVFVLGEPGEELREEAELLLDLVLSHDLVVSW